MGSDRDQANNVLFISFAFPFFFFFISPLCFPLLLLFLSALPLKVDGLEDVFGFFDQLAVVISIFPRLSIK